MHHGAGHADRADHNLGGGRRARPERALRTPVTLIRAELSFNEAGKLTNFVSDDRFQASADGTTMRRVRWSTPIRGYRTAGAMRLPSGGEGRWHDAQGDYAYIDLTIDDVQYNVQPR
jgi:hypothetical protein